MDNGMSQISCLLAKIGHTTSPVTCPNRDNMLNTLIKIRFFALLESRSTSERNPNYYEFINTVQNYALNIAGIKQTQLVSINALRTSKSGSMRNANTPNPTT